MRKITSVVSILVALWVSGCSPSKTPVCSSELRETPHTFVVTAFQIEEYALVGESDSVVSECSYNDILYSLLETNNSTFITFMSGVGPERAFTSTEATLESFAVSELFFSGIAGGLSTELEIGQTFIPVQWGDIQSDKLVPVDENLLAISKLTLTDVTFSPMGATSQTFIETENDINLILEKYQNQAVIVDMESFFVAQVAKEHEVPFIAVRSVSDFATGERDQHNYVTAAQSSAHAVMQLVQEVSKTP